MKLCLTLALASPLLLPAGNVHVVSPSGPFTNIQSAVDAAANGDIVLVRPGSYVGFQMVGRSVAVVADTGPSVTIFGRVLVRNSTSPILLAGLEIQGSTGSLESDRNALSASVSTGALRVQDCRLLALPPSTSNSLDRHGALVQDCPDVAITRSVLTGGDMTSFLPSGLTGSCGLVARRSSVALHDSLLQGGRSTICQFGYMGGEGGEGLRSQDSFVLAASSFARGGDGAQCSCADGGASGYGVYATGSLANVVHLDTTLLAGVAGQGNAPYQCPCVPVSICCDCYNDGWAVPAVGTASGAQVSALSAPGRGLAGPNVVRAGMQLDLVCSGEPGDFVSLAVSRTLRFQWRPSESGVSLVAPTSVPERYRVLGTIPASGVLLVQVPVPLLPAGVQGEVMHLQAFHDAAGGTRHLSSPLSVAIVDPTL